MYLIHKLKAKCIYDILSETPCTEHAGIFGYYVFKMSFVFQQNYVFTTANYNNPSGNILVCCGHASGVKESTFFLS